MARAHGADRMSASRRRVVEEVPFNAEVPLSEVACAPGEGAVFVRSHFDLPVLSQAEHRVEVAGAVVRPAAYRLDDLRRWPGRSVELTLECAGNGRSLMRPQPRGTAWGLGAAGNAIFEGVALQDLLEEAGVEAGALEVLAAGADAGTVASGARVAFERSLPLAVALRGDVLLAHTLNGAPLPREHGFPLRLVVPGWYGVASVKWLTRLSVLRTPFAGWFQKDTYVYDGESGVPDGTPVRAMRVRALITSPEEGAVLRDGAVAVEGAAWSGSGPVVAVALSADEGVSWTDLELEPARGPWLRRRFRGTWIPPGPGSYTLLARATDATGATQPLDAVWNRLGYGNNAVHRVQVVVDPSGSVLRSM